MRTKLILLTIMIFCFFKTNAQGITAGFDNAIKVGDSLNVDIYYKNIYTNSNLFVILKKVNSFNQEIETVFKENIKPIETIEEYISLSVPIKIPESTIESSLLTNNETYEITIVLQYGSLGENILMSSEKITVFKNVLPEFIYKTYAVPKITEDQVDTICNTMKLKFAQAQDTIEYVRKDILNIMGLDPNSPNPKIHDPIITKFFNKNINHIICSDSRPGRLRPKLSFFKYVLDIGDFEFLTKTLYKSTCPRRGQENAREYFNINSYDTIDGKKETLIDFMDKILNNPNKAAFYSFDTIKRIRSTLTRRCNAKKASQI